MLNNSRKSCSQIESKLLLINLRDRGKKTRWHYGFMQWYLSRFLFSQLRKDISSVSRSRYKTMMGHWKDDGSFWFIDIVMSSCVRVLPFKTRQKKKRKKKENKKDKRNSDVGFIEYKNTLWVNLSSNFEY